MKKRIDLMLLVTACAFLMFSCTEEQNFDQIDDLTVTPTLATPLFYVESDEQTINNSVTTTTFYTQTVDFEVFSETYVAERLLEGTITYAIDNTTSKNLFLTIEFLDASGNVLDVESFNIEANLSETFIREVVYGPGGKSLDILTATTQLRITATNLGDTTSTSTNADPKIELGSAAEFLFQLK
ncbi:hypothetical protein [Flagellimonas beolgyonensis]|uniref:hypothetical protein n=1 Tax=Flagellimonas beolgyonensis TaxID=864064 RepID=UPI000F8D15A2|nr:hypothetical protein [Allomuricauda beolgyonensis]